MKVEEKSLLVAEAIVVANPTSQRAKAVLSTVQATAAATTPAATPAVVAEWVAPGPIPGSAYMNN